MKRVIVVVNKWWECDPVMGVLLNANAAPGGLPWPSVLNLPRRRPDQLHLPPENLQPQPRAVFQMTQTSAEIWCVSDLLEHLPDKGQFQSSSEQKAKVLPKIFTGAPADLVIAVGTAGLPSDAISENGNVVVGTQVFIHNGSPNGSNPDSNWTVGPFDQIIDSALTDAAFSQILGAVPASAVANLLLSSVIVPAASNRMIASRNNAALGTINVTDYTKYVTSDVATVRAFAPVAGQTIPLSLETTHGLIRVQSPAPFLFISGITDRLGHFDQEVTPRSDAQNTVAAHNAGVALAWLLPAVNGIL